MKKLLIFIIGAIFIISGCKSNQQFSNTADTSQNEKVVNVSTWDRDGIKFNYPDNLVASYGETGNIQVFKPTTFSEYTEKCAADMSDDFDFWEARNEYVKDMEEGLETLKEEGVTDENMDEILIIDNDGCGWTAGNIKATPITVSGLNGAIFERCECQEVGWLNSLYTALIVVNQYDEVYEIRFRYDFGDFEGGVPENYVADEEWYSVYNYFLDKEPIETKWLEGFMDNSKIIYEIIDNVEIQI